MKIIIYGSFILVLCVSIYLNISFSRTINKLVKNVQLQEVNNYPFLHIKEIPAYNQAYYKVIKDLYFK